MLKFSVLFLTSRKAMIEVEDFGIWNTNEPYEIWLNGEKYMESIDSQGLIPKSRLYVHLSGDYATAVKVGARHGKPVVYRVAAGEMEKAGFRFYQSVNGVWLTKGVPAQYLKRTAEAD